MYSTINWAAVVPMANEESDFKEFTDIFRMVLDELGSGIVYFVVDNASKDRTRELCEALSVNDARFITIWAPENRNVVQAYLKGTKLAYNNGHEIIIEMDAGLSHDPRAIPAFLRVLKEGNEVALGSRYINGGSMADSPLYRRFLSIGGTMLAKLLLGARPSDMTSGFQGFHRKVMVDILSYHFLSTGHFYQTEMRYLVRNKRWIEVPIHYRAPSPRVSPKSISNSISSLMYYTYARFYGAPKSI